jgi:hypothetical protein
MAVATKNFQFPAMNVATGLSGGSMQAGNLSAGNAQTTGGGLLGRFCRPLSGIFFVAFGLRFLIGWLTVTVLIA